MMVVSPIMLIRIYINDITAGIESQIRLFADDCIMYRTINSFQDHIILQHDFKTLTEWVNTWQMEFNVSKCNILQISNVRNKSTYQYKMYDTPLKYVSEHKYLGVWIDEKLSWHSHVSKTCNKANKIV